MFVFCFFFFCRGWLFHLSLPIPSTCQGCGHETGLELPAYVADAKLPSARGKYKIVFLYCLTDCLWLFLAIYAVFVPILSLSLSLSLCPFVLC